jgi:hypothetical protein
MFEVTKERQSETFIRAGAWGKYLSRRVFDILRNSGIPCELTLPDGRTERFGEASPQFKIILKNSDALKAISRLNEMRIAYIAPSFAKHWVSGDSSPGVVAGFARLIRRPWTMSFERGPRQCRVVGELGGALRLRRSPHNCEARR